MRSIDVRRSRTHFKGYVVDQRFVTELKGGPHLAGTVTAGHLHPPHHWLLSGTHTHTHDFGGISTRVLKMFT